MKTGEHHLLQISIEGRDVVSALDSLLEHLASSQESVPALVTAMAMAMIFAMVGPPDSQEEFDEHSALAAGMVSELSLKLAQMHSGGKVS